MPCVHLPNKDTIYYEQHGNGDQLILISGFGGDHSAWYAILDDLKKHFTVTIFDNRGIGKSKSSGKFDIHDMVDDVIALMDHLDIPKAHIWGHSMGTKIALEFAKLHPTRLEKMILMCGQATPISFPFGPFQKIISELLDLNVPMNLIRRCTSLWAYSESFCNDKQRYDAEMARNAKVANTFTEDGLASQSSILLTDQSTWLDKIQIKTLVIAGKQDRGLLPAESELMAENLPNATLAMLDPCAHIPQEDNPESLICEIQAFLLKQ